MKKIQYLIIAVFSTAVSWAQQTSPSHFRFPSASAIPADPVCELIGTTAITATNATVGVLTTGKTYVAGQSQLQEKSKSAKLFFKLDLGVDYVVSQQSIPEHFKVKVKLSYNINGTAANKELIITDMQPEKLVSVDYLSDVNGSTVSPTVTVSVDLVDINDGATVPQPLTSGTFIKNYIDNNLRVSAFIEREYLIDVRKSSNQLMAEPLIIKEIAITGKRGHFEWDYEGQSQNFRYPNYEIQIVRLHGVENIETGSVEAKLDWSEALKVETQSYKTSIDLSIMEGTGFYLWRIRPIGTYYEGGIANSENYGLWSNDLQTGDIVSLNSSNIYGWSEDGVSASPAALADYKLFYFHDEEENLNWMYSRVFAESNNDENGVLTSEGISYADPLMRVRQSQAYNNQDKTTIVSQAVADFSGRNAISILPVPLENQNNGLEGYKSTFVQNSNGELYTAFDFDLQNETVDKVANPSLIKDDNTAHAYYNGTRTDGVADAEGYTFSRAIYKTDGTSRVSEASGIGSTFALGTQHTNRIFYSSPSDDELMRVFGAEAPLAESVIKTVTVDPNGVVKVAYTSKEGKTIATAMMTSSTSNLLPLENPGQALTVNNTANQNMTSENTFVSTKRIALWEDKQVTISYKVVNNTNECSNCKYAVHFQLINLETNEQYISDANATTSSNAEKFYFTGLDVAGSLNFASYNWRWVKLDNLTVSAFPVTGATFTLPKGEYLLKKIVVSDNSPEQVTQFVNLQSEAVETLIAAIQDQMGQVTNTVSSEAFEDLMADVSVAIATHNTAAVKQLLGITDESFVLPEHFLLSFNQGSGNTPSEMVITSNSTCAECPPLTISVPKPDVCELCSEDAAIGGIYSIMASTTLTAPEKFTAVKNLVVLGKTSEPDGFIDYLLANELRVAMNNDVEFFKQYAPGFDDDKLATMLTNMLISKYYTGNRKFDANGLAYAAIEDASGQLKYLKADGTLTNDVNELGVQLISAMTHSYNYNCKDLLNCWMQAVDMIGQGKFDESVNIMSEYNNRTDDDSSEDEYDNEENQEDAEDKGRFQGVMDFIISHKMRKFNDSDEGTMSAPQMNAMLSLPMLFMDCAGYQFAEILDDDFASQPSKMPLDYGGWIVTGPTLMEKNGTEWVNSEITCECDGTTNELTQLQYSYVVKPEWMFKYFVYNSEDSYNDQTVGNIEDVSTAIICQKEIELSTCYNDPYVVCLGANASLPKCSNQCNYYHSNWSAGQRLNFYQMIKGGNKCPREICPIIVDAVVPVVPDCYTEAQLKQMQQTKIDEAIQSYTDRRGEFKEAIIEELLNSCYTLVECITASSPENEVGEAQIDAMVDKVIEACSLKVASINLNDATYYWSTTQINNLNGQIENGEYPYCEIIGCKGINSNGDCVATTYREVRLFPECHQNILDQINNWVFDVNIPKPSNVVNCEGEEQKQWTGTAGTCDTQVTSAGVSVSTQTTIVGQ